MIKFSCPKCGQSIRVDDKYAGKSGKCPRCGTAVEVPSQSSIITFCCGSCGMKIKVSSRHAGRKGRCPKCKEAVVVPGGGQAPAEESSVRTIACSMCGRKIEVPEDSAGTFVECPACGSFLDASTGLVASESASPVPSKTEGESHREPAPAPATSTRPNRRLLMLVVGVLAVAVAAHIGLVLFLRSRDSASGSEPTVPRRPDVVEAQSPIEPATAEASPSGPTASSETVSPSRPEFVQLRFSPHPGTGPTLRVTTRLDISSQEAGQQVDIASTQSFTVALEAKEIQADETIPVAVTLRAIQVRTQMGGTVLGEYDSAKPLSETDSMAGVYVPFVGKRFTIHVSDQGELLDPGFDELFLAVAAGRVEVEDEMMREQLKERAEQAIAKADQRYGSRRSRALALKQQFEESFIFGTDAIRGLLDHLIVRLPEEPVQKGSQWDGPIPLRLEARFEIPGNYTITVLEEDSCKIVAEGRRGMEDEPIIYQVGATTVSSQLGGSSQIDRTVDRATGWLRSAEQRTSLRGRVLRTTSSTPGQAAFSDVVMAIITTVTAVE
jgi:DNA-directed RNA polymerase subunit RPC12/RpoP